MLSVYIFYCLVVRTGFEPACGPCVYLNYNAAYSTPFNYSVRLPIPPPDYIQRYGLYIKLTNFIIEINGYEEQMMNQKIL